MAEQAQQPEDARPPREQLWRRLLDGQVTEVYVTGFENRENSADFGLAYTLAHRRRVAKIRREGRAFTEEDAWSEFFAQTADAAARGELTRSEYAAYEVRERYRDKTFVILDPKDRRRLRATRAAARNG